MRKVRLLYLAQVQTCGQQHSRQVGTNHCGASPANLQAAKGLIVLLRLEADVDEVEVARPVARHRGVRLARRELLTGRGQRRQRQPCRPVAGVAVHAPQQRRPCFGPPLPVLPRHYTNIKLHGLMLRTACQHQPCRPLALVTLRSSVALAPGRRSLQVHSLRSLKICVAWLRVLHEPHGEPLPTTCTGDRARSAAVLAVLRAAAPWHCQCHQKPRPAR